eukprot:TRINITY_DN1593_c0_g2_i1.p1 TRINITY_DN1593_c0_g2~~TRINITY_DN1593_c0_g2_i1.p1  ORF type:complete len:616 (+),score=130.84 TRINITY_DN1593_c0_g2_i1:34-1848(+)
MKDGAILIIVLLALVSGQNIPETTHSLQLLSNYQYGLNEDSFDVCNYTSGPCAKLNDIWGYEFEHEGKTKYFAIVGVTNGIDLVDVTDPKNPEHVFWWHGCLNTWRDFKVWGKYVYGISENTITCNCEEGEKCLEHMIVNSPPSIAGHYPATEGNRFTPPLSEVGPVTAELIAVEPWDLGACDYVWNPEHYKGKIALLPVGDCMYSQSLHVVQELGAVGVIFVNSIDDETFPGMTGSSTNVNIPGVLVGKSDGLSFKSALENGPVNVTLTAENKQVSPLYSPPEGLTILDLSDPYKPTMFARDRTDFKFAHNLYIEEDRPWMYICGMSDRTEDQDKRHYLVANGGMMIFDLSKGPSALPEPIIWNTTYIHDLTVQNCDGKYILFGAAIYDDYVYVLDADDPKNLKLITKFHGRNGMSHNVWVDKTCSVMYVTHEQEHLPISVWGFGKDENGDNIWNVVNYLGSISINAFHGALPHNVFSKGDELWASYYSEGVAVWDISDPYLPILKGHYDTNNFTHGFHGVWGVYPYASSGYIYGSDIEGGLFVLELVDKKNPNDSEWFIPFIISTGIGGALLIGLLVMLGYFVKLRSIISHSAEYVPLDHDE